MSTSDSGPTGPESSSHHSPRTCPHCGAVLPADAPEGQCPACLLQNLTLEPTVVSPTEPVEPPRPPSPPLTPAELAPHFPQLEILECLGRGGMGVVYKARQKSLNRLVALKLLAPEREKDAAFAERFTREAQALALLSHSHIVTVYDFGVTSPSAGGVGDGFYYLLMEYVDGVNLRQLLDQRKLTPEEALAIVPPLCDALEYAHERGIVHRDIKPENLLLDRRGQVKIADFGIAKMLGNGTPSHTTEGVPVAPTPVPLGVTQPETALGTPAYMAPEQASAPERVDSRADIYSLGVVFYEMLTGELPAKQIEAASSRLKNLHIDVRVDEIVLRALEKKPEMRWQTAAEFRTRVEAVSSVPAASGSPPALPPTPPPAVAPAPPSPPPFRPWMQRFVVRPVEARRGMFWGLLAAGLVLAVLFMMPVEEVSLRPEGGEWKKSAMHGMPDPWFVKTEQSPSAPSDPGRARQLVREFRPLSVSYAAGLAAAVVWLVFWSFFAAEQRAGTRLPPGQRAFAMPLAERSGAEPVRIRWSRVLLLLLAFLATVASLSGHMSALMMLMLHDAPNPLFNAVFTALFLSFVFIRIVGQELAGAPSGSAQAAPMHHAQACGPTAAAAGFVTAYVAPFLFALLGTMMTGHVRDRALISVFLVTWGVSTVVAHYLLSRRKLAQEDQRRWLRITSICGWIISLPVIGFGIFFFMAGADEGFRWNPSPAEAFVVPIIALGTVLLPVASAHLWRASGIHAPAPRHAGRMVLGILLLGAAVALPVAGIMMQWLGQTRAHVVYQRERTELRRLAIQEMARVESLLEAQRALRAEQLRAQDLAKREEFFRAVAEHERKIADARASVEELQRKESRLTLPRVPGVFLGPALFGSLLCVLLAVLLFRRPTPAVGLQPVHVIMVLTLLVIGHAVVGLSRARTAAPVSGMAMTLPGGTALVYDGVLLRGTSVEHLPGTRHVRLHFTRSDHSALGLETSQDINLSPEGRGPVAVGTPGWKLTHWVGPEGPHILAWTLPAEFSDADMEDVVRHLRKDWLRERALPSGGVPVFARVKHRDGWVCTLLARVKRSPGAGEPVSAPYAPSASAIPRMQPADPPVMDTSDAALRTLSWHTFDQTPGQYWRQLADVRRFREAAELIERYLALHPELAEGAQQMNGANLHFHAGQCHAFARNKEKALEHLRKALQPQPEPNQDSLLWHYYVNATMFFLLGERDGLITIYEQVATRTVFNYPNIIVLDRLLAGFGKPYAEAYESNESDDHKKLSADYFNRAWELLDTKTRSPEEDAQMLSYAHASLAHWRQREDCKTRNLSIAYWQISRVYAVLRDRHSARAFAQLCLAASSQESPYYLGYAYEAAARAALLGKDFRQVQTDLAHAKAQAALIQDADERKMLEKDLNELEALAPVPDVQ